MKVVALCFFALVLVNASIVSAGFFTPSPEQHKTKDDNDDVTVNIEKDDGVTKVYDDDDQKGGFLAKAKEKLKEASSSVLPDSQEEEEEVHHKFKDYTKGTAHKVKEGAREKAKEMMKDKGKKGLKGVFGFLVSPVLFAGVMHLLGFATAYGMCVWVTFGSNYVLAKALPRQQFAMVQSKMYPVYFKAMATTVGVALVGNAVGQKTRRLSPYGLGIFRGFDLLPPLLMVLVNLIYLEPRASKIMSERMKKEKEEGGDTTEGEEEKAVPRGVLLGRLNSYSSLLNVATLMALTWHLVHLGHHLHAVC